MDQIDVSAHPVPVEIERGLHVSRTERVLDKLLVAVEGFLVARFRVRSRFEARRESGPHSLVDLRLLDADQLSEVVAQEGMRRESDSSLAVLLFEDEAHLCELPGKAR